MGVLRLSRGEFLAMPLTPRHGRGYLKVQDAVGLGEGRFTFQPKLPPPRQTGRAPTPLGVFKFPEARLKLISRAVTRCSADYGPHHFYIWSADAYGAWTPSERRHS